MVLLRLRLRGIQYSMTMALDTSVHMEFYYKMRQVFYYKMRWFYYKMWRLL